MKILFSIIMRMLRIITRDGPSGEPRIIQYLLYPFLTEGERENFIGDLIQDYKKICSECNKAEADRWLYNEVFNSLGPLIKRPAIFINFLCKLKIFTLLRSRRLTFAAALAMLIGFISLAIWLVQPKSNQVSLVQNRPLPESIHMDTSPDNTGQLTMSRESRSDVSTNARSIPVKRSQTKSAKDNTTTSIASVVVMTSPIVFRDMEQDIGDNEKFIKISTTRVRMKLLLAAGSTRGDYDVSILDAFGNPLIVNKVQSNGKFIITTFDMRKIPPKKYYVSVSHEGESPSFYPIVVVKK